MHRHRQRPLNRAHLAIQRQLPDDHDTIQRRGRYHSHAAKLTQRNGEVVCCPALAQVRRRQIDNSAAIRWSQLALDDGVHDALTALAYRRVR